MIRCRSRVVPHRRRSPRPSRNMIFRTGWRKTPTKRRHRLRRPGANRPVSINLMSICQIGLRILMAFRAHRPRPFRRRTWHRRCPSGCSPLHSSPNQSEAHRSGDLGIQMRCRRSSPRSRRLNRARRKPRRLQRFSAQAGQQGPPAVPLRIRPVPQAPAADASSLASAKAELARGNIAAALNMYGRLIRRGKSLTEIIRELRDALYRYPVEVPIWQALGDAYMRANRLQEALDAYTKAEELLR